MFGYEGESTGGTSVRESRLVGSRLFGGEDEVHDRIAANIRAVLANLARGTPFRVVGRGERAIAPPWLSLAPDLLLALVVEGVVVDPMVVIEVITVGSARLDRIFKNRVYRSMSSVLQYVMVSTDRPRIETVTRGEGDWSIDAAAGIDGRVALPGNGLHLFLSDVYAETGLT